MTKKTEAIRHENTVKRAFFFAFMFSSFLCALCFRTTAQTRLPFSQKLQDVLVNVGLWSVVKDDL